MVATACVHTLLNTFQNMIGLFMAPICAWRVIEFLMLWSNAVSTLKGRGRVRPELSIRCYLYLAVFARLPSLGFFPNLGGLCLPLPELSLTVLSLCLQGHPPQG